MKTNLFLKAAILFFIFLIVGCSKDSSDDINSEIEEPPVTYYKLVKAVRHFSSSPSNSTEYVYDSNNEYRLDKIIFKNSNGEITLEYKYEYNTSGQLITRIQGNNTNRYSYDDGLIISSITETDGNPTSSTEYLYNNVEQMISKVVNDTCEYNFIYDNQNNPIRETDDCQGFTWLNEYDNMKNSTQLILQDAYRKMLQDGNNNRTRFECVGEFTSTLEYVYNSEGYPIERIQLPHDIRTTYEYKTFED